MSAVSVIIPAYNQCNYIGEAIQSVLSQTYQDFEVIVVDDGSTDDTRQVVESFTDPRISYLYQENRGLSGARNTGIQNATSDYISFLDSDDLFHPEKLALLTTVLDENPEIGFVAGKFIQVDEEGKSYSNGSNSKSPDLIQSSQFALHNPLFVGSVLLRRCWIDKVGCFDESLRAYEDWDMWLRLAQSGCPMKFVEQPVAYYRFHKSQMTREPERLRTASFAMLDKLFENPDLPETWRDLRDQAYCNAHLRAAAQAYRTGLLLQAKSDLLEAVELNPELCSDEAAPLAMRFSAWADDPRTDDPLMFLEKVYDNLPDELEVLSRRRNEDLARVAMRHVYETNRNQDFETTESYLWQAVRYQPELLTNRGVWSIFVKSWFRILKARLFE